MFKKNINKPLILITIGVIFIFLIFNVYSVNKIRDNIFRLSSDQVLNLLKESDTQCNKIKDCKLLPGDILIRRYITKRVWLIDKLAHPYFTHSAFYLNDNQIVEAAGVEKNRTDDIQIATFSESDWINFDVNNFVIIRPKERHSEKLGTIRSNLKNIAEDRDYRFGLPKQGHKRATCADLIFQQLSDEKIINTLDTPKIITPDYLFWVLKNNPNDFEIIGYNI
jgi:hypothetical protein